MKDREEINIIECQINHLTSENIQLEQKFREGQDANFELIRNREKLRKLMLEFVGDAE